MISKDCILEWRKTAPWSYDDQVEQDLLISRALVELFSREEVSRSLAFRGGTALYKLFLDPARYSEDIDLVQMNAEPIGPVLTALREALDPLLGEPKRKFGAGRTTITYRYESEELPPTKMRLKIEINTREHFTVLGFTKRHFRVKSSWFEGGVEIPTYHLEELMGTKLRALYQRRKGRDLFDLWFAFQNGNLSPEKVVDIFYHYIDKQGLSITRAHFEKNIEGKSNDSSFLEDIHPLLPSGFEDKWNFSEALEILHSQIFPCLRGEAWKGSLV